MMPIHWKTAKTEENIFNFLVNFVGQFRSSIYIGKLISRQNNAEKEIRIKFSHDQSWGEGRESVSLPFVVHTCVNIFFI